MRGKVVIRRSRRGKVLTVAREHYLRDDIACGSKLCRVCPVSRMRVIWREFQPI